MNHKLLKASIWAMACVTGLFVLTQAHADHLGLNIQIGIPVQVDSEPPPPPHVIEKPWAPPYRGAVWIEPHYEWVHGHWDWIHGYYTYPPTPGYVWVPAHYEFAHHHHTWIAGYWVAPAPVVVVPPPPAPAPVVVQPPPPPAPPTSMPYGNRIGTTTQIQSPYSSNIITSTAPRDTVVYDPSTGQPFRIP